MRTSFADSPFAMFMGIRMCTDGTVVLDRADDRHLGVAGIVNVAVLVLLLAASCHAVFEPSALAGPFVVRVKGKATKGAYLFANATVRIRLGRWALITSRLYGNKGQIASAFFIRKLNKLAAH